MIFISKASSSNDGQKHRCFSIYDFNTGGRMWGNPGCPHCPLLPLGSQAGCSPSGGASPRILPRVPHSLPKRGAKHTFLLQACQSSVCGVVSYHLLNYCNFAGFT